MKHIEGFENRLLKAINDKGMTNSQVCAITGITWNSMNCYINEKQMPSCLNLVRLANVLDVSTDYLLGLKEPGHWIEDKDDNRRWDRVRFTCSYCGKWQTYGKTKFCPACGRRMEI